ncbi:Phosphomannomutase [Minicystis rosea]|nr:Phosphomannomutase [Minicystis rosea]
MTASSLFERAERWLQHDPDPDTRAELVALLDRAKAGDAAAIADLTDRFIGPLEFGTAGLRGLIGAGESRMNRAVVLRTALGLGRYLLAQDAEGAKKRGVVIGYDGRRLGPELAEDTACVLATLGIPSKTTPRPCSTPLLAFAVKDLDAVAGVMVTASHNPPAYNGYKVYWGNGAQIIPPHDKGIAACIAESPDADAVPRLPLAEAEAKGFASRFGDDVERRYLDAVRALSVRPDGDRSITIVYTPLHGTGNRLTRMALAEAGFTDVSTVPEQAEPDGTFPTVEFPNPEEKGALDLAFALARKKDAPLVIANDPDVDRLAVAVRDPSGKYVQLTGNQVGALLGHYILTEGAKAHGDRLVLASLVSSPMLGAIARTLGVRYEETLTGFKWIANRAMEIEKETGTRFVFGFEEALGYTVGSVVRDKDGISAAVILAELAAVRWAEKKTLLDELEALARKFGLFVSGQKSLTMPGADGLAQIGEIMKRLRAAPPKRVGDLEVLAVGDYQAQARTAKDGTVTKIALPKSNVLTFELEGGSRIIARPSGTEPKIKFYFDLCEPISAGEAVADAQARAEAKMAELSKAFVAAAGVS